jgi:Nitroreductase family
MLVASPIHQILDLARWAPSGDNTQPWRFEVLDESHLVIHGFDTREHCIYDLDGHPSQISLGALIETISIASSQHALSARVVRREGTLDSRPTFDVYFAARGAQVFDPLLQSIPSRSVHRRAMATKPLTVDERGSLETALPSGYKLQWFEGWENRWRLAKLMFRNAKLRLTTREAFEVHRTVIDWGKQFSADRVPDKALGLDPLTLRLMRWALQDWRRVSFLNQWLAGTLLPRLQMDLLPPLFCAAHVAILRDTAPSKVDDYIESGRAIQRFWLTATSLGLQHQPELTPIIFSRYVRNGIVFSADPDAINLATMLHRDTDALFDGSLPKVVWLGRLGTSAAARPRSLRRSLAGLQTWRSSQE